MLVLLQFPYVVWVSLFFSSKIPLQFLSSIDFGNTIRYIINFLCLDTTPLNQSPHQLFHSKVARRDTKNVSVNVRIGFECLCIIYWTCWTIAEMITKKIRVKLKQKGKENRPLLNSHQRILDIELFILA